MDREKKIKINEDRNELVVKSNDLIRNTRYNLSVVEQKIVIYLISKIIAEDKDLKTVDFSVSEYCDLTGIRKGGRGYQLVKDSIRSLRNKSYWIPTDEETEILFSWIDTAEIKKKSGIIEIKLSESLKPFLLQLKGNFTKYELINVLTLSSKYSIRLYELLKSYLWLHTWEIDIESFRELMLISDKYKEYKDLQRYVIQPSLREINKYTDLSVDFYTRKNGRKINKLGFKIDEKEGVQMTLDLLLNQEERLRIRNEKEKK